MRFLVAEISPFDADRNPRPFTLPSRSLLSVSLARAGSRSLSREPDISLSLSREPDLPQAGLACAGQWREPTQRFSTTTSRAYAFPGKKNRSRRFPEFQPPFRIPRVPSDALRTLVSLVLITLSSSNKVHFQEYRLLYPWIARAFLFEILDFFSFWNFMFQFIGTAEGFL